jgi:hypothetical protein
MGLSILVLLLVAGTGYIHYLHGLFSSVLSAIIAFVAAMAAIAFHESLAQILVSHQYPDQSVAISVVVLFAAVYAILRFGFDKMIPGNVRVPLLVDKIGSAACGVLVGLLATGVFVFAVESMPLGPAIMGYSRYPVADARQSAVHIPTQARDEDVTIYDEVKVDSFGTGPDDRPAQNHLLTRSDDFDIALLSLVSAGSLSGDTQLAMIHPDWPLEMFGQRIGMQAGARRSLINLPVGQELKLSGLYSIQEVKQIDNMLPSMHTLDNPLADKISSDSHPIVIIRTVISGNNGDTDDDKFLRLATGNVRLDANGVDYFPTGTMEGSILLFDKPDDPLAVNLNSGPKTVDWVFLIPPDAGFGREGKSLPSGSFLEVKRFARVDLGGQKPRAFEPMPNGSGIFRNMATAAAAAKAAGSSAGTGTGVSTPPGGSPGGRRSARPSAPPSGHGVDPSNGVDSVAPGQ